MPIATKNNSLIFADGKLAENCDCCLPCSKDDSDPNIGTSYSVAFAGSSTLTDHDTTRCVGLSRIRDIKITQRLVVLTMDSRSTASVNLSNSSCVINTGCAGSGSYCQFGVASDFGDLIPGTSPARRYDRAQARLAGGTVFQNCCLDYDQQTNGFTIEAEWRRIGGAWSLHESWLDGSATSLSGAVGGTLDLPASSGKIYHGPSATNGPFTFDSYYMRIEYL